MAESITLLGIPVSGKKSIRAIDAEKTLSMFRDKL